MSGVPMTMAEFCAITGANGLGHALCKAKGHADTNPSLHIYETAKVKGGLAWGFRCVSRGCPKEDILAAYNLTWADLYGREPAEEGKKKKERGELAAEHVYRDAAGAAVFRAVRFNLPNGRKRFELERAKPDGTWKRGRRCMEGCPRILYRLPALLAALPSDLVFWVEGEKAADRLAAHGLVVTTTAEGANGFATTPAEHVRESVRGRRVVILPDNDEPGRAYAEDVARCVHDVAASVAILELPLEDKGADVVDWLAAGGTREELERAAAAARPWQPPRFNMTESGNAKRLVAAHGQDLRYVGPWKRWLVWDGRRWTVDLTGEIHRRAASVVHMLDEELGEADGERRVALRKWATLSESARVRAATVRLAESELPVVALPEHLDRDPYLFNCMTGTIDLRTGTLRPHRREDMLTKLAPVEFSPTADATRWESFLREILPSADLRAFVRRAFGYCLTGDISEHAFFVLWGAGQNGKSTLMERFMELLGDYAVVVKASTLLLKRQQDGSAATPDIARLRGARFAAVNETTEGARLDMALIKDMTGGDTMSARHLYGEDFDFRPEFKLVVRTNHKPVIRGTDLATWRRPRLIPFTVSIPDEKKDTDLPRKLQAELPGILNWALAGCLEWRRHGLGTSAEVAAATAAYRAEQDVVGAFIAECCTELESAWVSVADLRKAYDAWCSSAGERPLGSKSFNERLRERGHLDSQLRSGSRGKGWQGIGLRERNRSEPRSEETFSRDSREETFQQEPVPNGSEAPSEAPSGGAAHENGTVAKPFQMPLTVEDESARAMYNGGGFGFRRSRDPGEDDDR